jgi:hypothetical protein
MTQQEINHVIDRTLQTIINVLEDMNGNKPLTSHDLYDLLKKTQLELYQQNRS